MTAADKHSLSMTVNGNRIDLIVESRRTLADVLREDLGLTGTHLACEHGVCGACTVALDGRAVRSCLMLALQADGASVETVESLCLEDGSLGPLQQAFADNHSFQCAFCAPGFLMTAKALLEREPNPSRERIREAVSGNLCRCTGYQQIFEAIEEAAKRLEAKA